MNVEEWRPVEGWPYEVSNLGRVRRARDGKHSKAGTLLNPTVTRQGYCRVTLTRGSENRTHELHVLVAKTFHGPRPSGLVCRHLDGNRLNNASFNLRWGTYKENSEDQRQHGTLPRGERSGKAKLTDNLVRKILTSPRDADWWRKKLGVTRSVIYSVRNRRTWKHVQVEAAA